MPVKSGYSDYKINLNLLNYMSCCGYSDYKINLNLLNYMSCCDILLFFNNVPNNKYHSVTFCL